MPMSVHGRGGHLLTESVLLPFLLFELSQVFITIAFDPRKGIILRQWTQTVTEAAEILQAAVWLCTAGPEGMAQGNEQPANGSISLPWIGTSSDCLCFSFLVRISIAVKRRHEHGNS